MRFCHDERGRKDAIIAQMNRDAREHVRSSVKKKEPSYAANLELLKGGSKSSGRKKIGANKCFYVDYFE